MSSAAEICVSEESELPVEAEELSEEKARSDPPECVVLIANIQKQKNSGQMVRSAAAFGCSKVVFTGDKGRVSSFGAKGAQKHIPMVWGGTKAREAITKLKAQGFTICGIEITPDARPVHEHPFRCVVYSDDASVLSICLWRGRCVPAFNCTGAHRYLFR